MTTALLRALKALLVSAIILFSTFALVAPAAAQSTQAQQSEYELRRLGIWSQTVTAFNTRVAAEIDQSEPLSLAIEQFSASQISEREFRTSVEAWRVASEARIAQYRVEYAALPQPPRFVVLAQLQSGADAILRRSGEMVTEIEQFNAQMIALTLAVVDDDVDVATAMQQRALQMVRALLVFENGSLTIMRAMSTPNHPNQSLVGSRIAFNEALVAVFDAYLRSAASPDGVSLSVEQRQRIRNGAAEMRRQNVQGRADTTRLQLDTEIGARSFSPAMREGITRLFQSLNQTFATLDEGAAILDRASALPDGAKFEQFEAVLNSVIEVSDELGVQNAERAAAIAATPAPSL